MIRFASCLGVLCLVACGPSNAPCRSLKIGQTTSGLPIEEISILGNTVDPTRPELYESFTVGPAVEHYFCSKCEADGGCAAAADAGISCESEALRGIHEWQLGKPYSFQYDPPALESDLLFSYQLCFVAEKDGSIVSVWSRYRGD